MPADLLVSEPAVAGVRLSPELPGEGTGLISGPTACAGLLLSNLLALGWRLTSLSWANLVSHLDCAAEASSGF